MTEYEALLNDERWQQAQEFIRQGAWHQALELLRELEKEYPDDTRLRSALMDVELRASLVEETTGEVHIPTRRRIPRRALTATVLIFVAIGLIITLYGGYQKYVAPAQVVAETQQELQQLYKEAQAALAQGDYQRAVDLFSQILQQAPEHEGAREGLEQARERLTLAQMYEEAMGYLEAGDKAKALALFRQIAEKDPEYRDVKRRISSLEKELTVQALFLQGETAFENGEWFTAISLFEEVRHLDGKYKKDIVRDRLYTAYYNYALEILATGEEDAPDPALEYVRKALSFNSRSEEARALRNDLMAYLRGRRAFAKGDYLTAVQKWAPLYERRPDFGNGMLARQLYRAYVELGKMREQEDNLPSAIHFYSLAVQLPVEDKSEAEERLSFLFLLITPTPTPTPLPMRVQGVYIARTPMDEVWILGEVINESGSDVEQAVVNAVLLDEDGRILASAEAPAALEFIPKGERSPFALRFREAPTTFAAYQVNVVRALPGFLGGYYLDLGVENVTGEGEGYRAYFLEGMVRNLGSEDAVGILLVATLYDAAGRVVGVREAAPEHNVLLSGGVTRFQMEVHLLGGPVASWRIIALGHRLLTPTPTP